MMAGLDPEGIADMMFFKARAQNARPSCGSELPAILRR